MNRSDPDDVLEAWRTVSHAARRPNVPPTVPNRGGAGSLGLAAAAAVVLVLTVVASQTWRGGPAASTAPAGSSTTASSPAAGASGPGPTADAPSAVGSVPPPSTAGIPAATVVKTARTNRYQSITLSPPGDVVPAVSSDAAYKVCQTPVGDCFPEPPTAIELALMTETAVGVDMSARTNVLVWVIGWYGVTDCTFAGGPGGSAPAAPPSATPLCDHASYINATTGEFIFATSNAHE